MLSIIRALNPWLILGIVAALSASHLYAYHLGSVRQKDAAATEKLQAVERAIEQTEAIARQDNEIARQNMAAVTEIRYRTRTIQTKEAAHAFANPLPDNCELDPVRMRNVNAALAGTLPADPGQPDYTLPTAARLAR